MSKISKNMVEEALKIATEKLCDQVVEKSTCKTKPLVTVDEEKPLSTVCHEKLLLTVTEEKLLSTFDEGNESKGSPLLMVDEDKPPSDNGNEFSLDRFLTNLLTKIEVPLSISFINLLLSQRKISMITERFLGEKEIQDKFSIFLIGCDLKIQLRKIDEKRAISNGPYDDEVFSIINKDINKLIDLKMKFNKDALTTIEYNDFLSRYSSNKYKMKLPFIVRNSHDLEIYKKEGNTCIRFVSEGQQLLQPWDFNKSFEVLLVNCLKVLLSNFTFPLNQGVLNSCFNLGKLVIDKKFLDKYRDVFSGSGTDGIMMKHNNNFPDVKLPLTPKYETNTSDVKVSNVPKITSPLTPACNSDKVKTTTITKRPRSNFQNPADEFCSKFDLGNAFKKLKTTKEIDNALEANQSIVLLGDSTNDTPIFYYHDGNSNDKIAALKDLKKKINLEIDKIT